jgi:hypothetical protein
MTKRTIISTVLSLSLLALAACSSSTGDGAPAPHNTTIVVPPGSSATTY